MSLEVGVCLSRFASVKYHATKPKLIPNSTRSVGKKTKISATEIALLYQIRSIISNVLDQSTKMSCTQAKNDERC